ncbi:MAG: hypothetical protein FDX30_01150 [Chlorobium sp.]|nr:MAG: hypothetical protein FDX30_01150 [Chlorobium sp.]
MLQGCFFIALLPHQRGGGGGGGGPGGGGPQGLGGGGSNTLLIRSGIRYSSTGYQYPPFQ